MEKLKTIEICDLSIIKVNAIKGKNIVDTGRECIELAKLLKTAVDLYFNDHIIRIYTTSTIEEIIEASVIKEIRSTLPPPPPPPPPRLIKEGKKPSPPPQIKEEKLDFGFLTSDRNDPRLKEGQKNETGQHDIYLVLSEEERSKGFVRPVRNAYVHIGKKPNWKEVHRMLDEDERAESKKEYSDRDEYVAVMTVLVDRHGKFAGGTYVTQKELDAWESGKLLGGCGTLTTMGNVLSETYARDPKFYGATFCCGCNKHLPVEEFVWDGTDERVGS